MCVMDRRGIFLVLYFCGMLCRLSRAQCVSVCNDDGTGYNSIIVFASDDFPNNFTLQWEPYPSDSFYIVQHRFQDSGSQFISSPILTDETYTITNLSPETDYEVRVCLANGTENDCGNCLKCFRTATAEEPPGPPREVQGISSGPQSFIIMWEEPMITNGGITGYIVSFGRLVDGLTTNVSRESNDRTFTVNSGITANTMYVIVVHAINDHGIGIPSEQAFFTTDTFSTDPGILLVSDPNQILYFSVNEGNVMDPTMVEGTMETLLLTNSTVLDIDYHYNRNEIYVTLNDSTIVRYSVNISLMEESSTFTLTLTNTEVIFSQLGDGLGAITVDWVNDLLYWVQYDGNQSQLYSGSLDGGDINTLGIPVNGQLDSLTVDPIHGYFYWVLINSHLAQIPLGSVMEADSLTNLIASAILQNDSSITAFNLDLADSQRLISSDRQVKLEGLGGDIRGSTTYFFSLTSILTSYGVVSMVGVSNVIVFRNVDTDMNLQGITNLNDTVGDLTIFRSTFQPLPVPPTPPSNIHVLASNTSTFIQWSGPQYPGDIFGVDAFNNWEYTVIYKPFNSSDSENSSSTCSTSLTLTSLTPGTVYQFTVTATGPGGSKTTAETYVFSTYGTAETTSSPPTEPPGPPREVQGISSGPQSFIIMWEEPTITNGGITGYIVSFGRLVDGLTTNVSRESDARTFTVNIDITANTTYVIVVYAINEHGIGIQSERASVTTDTFSTDPGILLVSGPNQILYFSVNRGNVMDSIMVEGTKQTLLLTNSTVLGIDYHYSRSEIYVTLNDNTIVRYSVNISHMEESSTFTLTLTNTEVIFSQLGDGLGAITVDWVNDLLYWVQYDGNQSQLYSGSLDGGDINTLGIPVNGQLDSLTVDPIHGYFYWVLINSHLAQIPLGSVMEADSSTNLIASAILQNDSFITAFNLDLADSQRLISSGTQVKLEGLDGDILGSTTYPFSLTSILTSYGVVSMVGVSNVIVFRNAVTNTNLQGIILPEADDIVGDLRIFRSTFQPLPAETTSSPPTELPSIFCTSNCNTQLTDVQYNLCCDSENYGNFIRVTKENGNTAYLICPLLAPDWCN